MKKIFSITIIFIFITNILFGLFSNISLANNEKKNPDSYWSTENAPLFYGATKITIKKGLLSNFDVLDSRFRIFAKDFEDGNLTPNIISTNNVNINEVGNYEIIYKVRDSHNNETKLVVPVIITDNEDIKINVERTIYTIPSVWNMDLAEFSRCNYGDRQILGIYLGENQSIRARVLSSDNNIGVSLLNNDKYQESSTTIPTSGEWIIIENIINDISYSSVPLITSTVLSKENTEINKTFKIELEYDENIKPLDYYHYNDNEEEFKNNWINSQNDYGVVESETLIMVVPYTDIKYMSNYYRNGFTSLDNFFDYYQKVVEKMDEYVGLSFNPVKLTDQNVRTKYLIKANRNGVGAAYYAGNHVGVNNESMRSFFEMNWGGLHELGHGYQGLLGKGEMLLGEVSNNILGHYIQTDKTVYFHPGNWLGELPTIEESRNSGRLSGKTFLEVDEPTRLYAIVNLLNTFEKGTTYGKMYSWYREQLNLGRTMTNQDAYVEALADIYNVNITPYMEDWGLEISDETKAKVYQKNYPLINILKDFVSDDTLNTIMVNEDLDRKYALVTNEVLHKYSSNSKITLTLNIDDINTLTGKYALIKNGVNTIKSIKIDSNFLEIDDLPIGTYYLQMPIIEGYSQDYNYIQVKEDKVLNYTHNYYKQTDVDYNNYLKLEVLGYNYDTIAYRLLFKDNFTKAEITYPNKSGMSGNEYIKIYNSEGSLITEDVSVGGYFDFNKGKHEIDLDIGSIIEVKYPNRYQNKIKIYSTLTGNQLVDYNATDTVTRYIVINNGLIKEGMEEDFANDLAYEQIKPSLISIIENYKAKVTLHELNNKFINFKEKAQVVDAFNRLKEVDQVPYIDLISSIRKGGSPIITAKADKLEYSLGTNIDLYSLISATDNEDGIIIIDKNSTVVDTNLNNMVAGIYNVTYKVSDTDDNVSIKIIQIEIIGNPIPEEKPDVPELPDVPDEEVKPEPEEPDIPSVDDTEKPVEPELPEEDTDDDTDDDTGDDEIPELPEDSEEQEPNPPVDEPEEEPDLPIEEEKPDVDLPEEIVPEGPIEPETPIEPEAPENNEDERPIDIPTLPTNDSSKPQFSNKDNKPLQNAIGDTNKTDHNNDLETISIPSYDIVEVPNLDENIIEKDVVSDEIEHLSIAQELPTSEEKLNIKSIIIVITVLAITSLSALFIVKTKIK